MCSEEVSISISSCSASSEYSDNYVCENAYDGDIESAWATKGEGIGSWIEFNFDSNYRATKMEFTNRPADVDKTSQILLTFSDGETQTVDLERGVTIAELVETNSVNSVRITVTGVYDTMNNGAMEIKFYGISSDAGNNNLFQSIFYKLL
jgi:hypothetical protein